MKVTRRKLARVLAATATLTAHAQAQPQPAGTAPQLDTARARLRGAAQGLARVPLPMAAEPAFQFKA